MSWSLEQCFKQRNLQLHLGLITKFLLDFSLISQKLIRHHITASTAIIPKITAKTEIDLVTFFREMLQTKKIRDGYRELLKLFIIFLSKQLTRGIIYITTSAISHARSMIRKFNLLFESVHV